MPLGTPFFHSQRYFQRSRARIPEILRHSADGCREGFILYVVGLPTLYLRYARDHEKEKKRSCWPQYDFPVSRRGKGPRFNFHPHPDLTWPHSNQIEHGYRAGCYAQQLKDPVLCIDRFTWYDLASFVGPIKDLPVVLLVSATLAFKNSVALQQIF